MLEINGEAGSQGGLFFIRCKKCKVETKNTHIQKDTFVWRFTATCEKCGETREFRLNSSYWVGLP